MNENELQSRVLDYLNGHLSPEEGEQLKTLWLNQGHTLEELDELQQVNDQLDSLDVPQPDVNMTDNFYLMLETHKHNSKHRLQIRSIWSLGKWAAAIMILLLGYGMGTFFSQYQHHEERLNDLSTEVHTLKTMMMAQSLSNETSPSERLRTIGQIKTYGHMDEQMAALLLKTLRSDTNINVRLVALETLVACADHQVTQEGLIQALNEQDSPLIQVALVDAMVNLQAKQAIGPLRGLLQQETLNYTVRVKIQDSLKLLM